MTPNAERGAYDGISGDAVIGLARLAGWTIPEDRLAAVTERLADLYRLAADLDGLDLAGVEPATGYDPRWPEEEETA
ncbi:MAG TPA: hypothetical protein VH482_34200 [Thermomicrobiales bacterium]|jgi:hypothetical protein